MAASRSTPAAIHQARRRRLRRRPSGGSPGAPSASAASPVGGAAPRLSAIAVGSAASSAGATSAGPTWARPAPADPDSATRTSRTCSSAAMNSSALANRSRGSFASARRTIASSSGGTAGFTVLGSGRRRRDLLQGDAHGRLAVEWDRARQQLVQDDADRIDVGGLADGVTLSLLGREVLGRPHDRAGHRHVGDAGAGDPEVRHLRPALFVEDDVVRLEVAVDDPAPVGEAGRAQDLDDDVDARRPVRAAPSRAIDFSERPGRYSIAM